MFSRAKLLLVLHLSLSYQYYSWFTCFRLSWQTRFSSCGHTDLSESSLVALPPTFLRMLCPACCWSCHICHHPPQSMTTGSSIDLPFDVTRL